MTTFDPSYRRSFHRTLANALRETLKPPKKAHVAKKYKVAFRANPQHRSQYWIIGIVLALNVIGLAMILSAGSVVATYEGQNTWFYFQQQGIYFLMGLLAMAVISKIDYRRWGHQIKFLLGVTFFLLFLVHVPGFGVNANGATRWVRIPETGITFQPSELLKLTILIYTAKLLADRQSELSEPRTFNAPVIIFVAAALLVMKQPDLGTVIIIGALMVIVMFLGGLPVLRLAGLVTAGAAVTLAVSMSADYRRARLLSFLQPDSDPLNTGYQTFQSLVGIASGGWMGVGPGASRAKWGFLPYAHTDFIYTVIAEEMGFIGAITVLMLFIGLAVFGIRAALRCDDKFGSLLGIGISMWFLLQAFINVGTVIGVLPVTGIPLPFVSFGGTSLLVGMAAVGMILNIDRQGQNE
ncbi:MAG TPA: putative lipid II flippase FtsW [Acidimicrobiaceae bacterium]|nr:putative lipid II flippase FtsW [Acidimicrobiaceae bacterium]